MGDMPLTGRSRRARRVNHAASSSTHTGLALDDTREHFDQDAAGSAAEDCSCLAQPALHGRVGLVLGGFGERLGDLPGQAFRGRPLPRPYGGLAR